jgi:hypothetical protein
MIIRQYVTVTSEEKAGATRNRRFIGDLEKTPENIIAISLIHCHLGYNVNHGILHTVYNGHERRTVFTIFALHNRITLVGNGSDGFFGKIKIGCD